MFRLPDEMLVGMAVTDLVLPGDPHVPAALERLESFGAAVVAAPHGGAEMEVGRDAGLAGIAAVAD